MTSHDDMFRLVPAAAAWRAFAFGLLLASLPPFASAAGIAASADDGSVVYVAGDAGLSARDVNGQVIWQALRQTSFQEPVVSGELLLAASADGLRALDRATGRVRWQAVKGVGLFPPAVVGDRAYVGALDGVLRAIDLRDGRVLWQHRFERWVYSPAIVGDAVISGGRSARLIALRAGDGGELWRRELSQELVYEPLALPAGRVLATTFSGDVLVLRAADGGDVWTVRESVPALKPARVGEVLVYALMDGRLRARALEDGRLLWERNPAAGRLLTPRAVGDGVVSVASEQGDLLWLDARSGEPRLRERVSARPLTSPLRAGNDLVTPLAGGAVVRHRLPEKTAAAGAVSRYRIEAETIANR